MSWSSSAMFRAWPTAIVQGNGTGWTGVDSDVIKAALYNNSVSPSKDSSVTLTGYNTGTWTSSGNEVSDGTNWNAGGEPLAGKTVTNPASGVIQFDANDTSQAGVATTLSSVYGCLVYDDSITAGTVADQGISYHYFGGQVEANNGTFTIVWHANGLWRISV